MDITGESLIGGTGTRGAGTSFLAFDPAAGAPVQPPFHTAGEAEVNAACERAAQDFDAYRETGIEERARFLETIAEEIEALGETLIARAMTESGLPRARLEGERGRTTGQLRLFAGVLREGSWLGVRVDTPLPQRQPPRPELRLRRIAVGPVAVFGASNFPLAFSVAGGDTAAALAAGCPVVAKAHPAHPGTSELVGRAIQRAVQRCKLPAGVFALLTGTGNELGTALVRHPAIEAVGFTGSRQGGLALVAAAAARPHPIPVYAEMSSINPVFLLPQALQARGADIARAFVDSLVLGAGQFCTNPGLVLGLAGPDFDRFAETARELLAQRGGGTMLTPGIHRAYEAGVAKLEANTRVKEVAQGVRAPGAGQAVPALFMTTADDFEADATLSDEVFGPTSLLVACRDTAQLLSLVRRLEGQLTATLQMDAGDIDAARALLPVLERKVGRILANGFPTGVEVSHAMVHGGPFPSTSDGRSTSVGSAAIERFLRPVSYQNLPAALLPEVLRPENPWSVPRQIDGLQERMG